MNRLQEPPEASADYSAHNVKYEKKGIGMKLQLVVGLFAVLALNICTVLVFPSNAVAAASTTSPTAKKVFTIQATWKKSGPQESILKDKKISAAIKTLLGDDFKLFNEATKVVDAGNVVVDKSSYTAHGASQDAASRRGYVSVTMSGNIYIAIITTDSVYYYSNDDYYKVNAPSQIDLWIEKYGLGRNNISKSK
jgi:hypothetical protein